MLASLAKPPRALQLYDPIDSDLPFPSLFEQRCNPGTALVPPL
jgi:hypothetical protein